MHIIAVKNLISFVPFSSLCYRLVVRPCITRFSLDLLRKGHHVHTIPVVYTSSVFCGALNILWVLFLFPLIKLYFIRELSNDYTEVKQSPFLGSLQ